MLILDSSSATPSSLVSILTGLSIVVGIGPSLTLSSALPISYSTRAIA